MTKVGIYRGRLNGRSVGFVQRNIPDDYVPYGVSKQKDRLVDSANISDRIKAVHAHYGLERLCDDIDWRVRLEVAKLGWNPVKAIKDSCAAVRSCTRSLCRVG